MNFGEAQFGQKGDFISFKKLLPNEITKVEKHQSVAEKRCYLRALTNFYNYSEFKPTIRDHCLPDLTMYELRFPNYGKLIWIVDRNDQLGRVQTRMSGINSSTGKLLRTFPFQNNPRYTLLHMDDAGNSGLILGKSPDSSHLDLHHSSTGHRTYFPAKFQSLPSPENSRFLHSYLSTSTEKDEVTKVALSADGFCALWSRNEEAYLYIRAFAEKDGVRVRLEDFQKELSNRESLRRLLPEKLKSVQGRTEAIKEEDFPLVIVEQAEWKKHGWKANPMGILRALAQGN